MDIRWKSNLQLIGWLLLFTFGLSGSASLVFRTYVSSSIMTYIYMACGLAALGYSLYTLRTVQVADRLRYAPLRALYQMIPIDLRVVAAFLFCLATYVKLGGNLLPFNAFDGIYFAQSLVTTTILVTLTMVQILFLMDELRDADSRQASWQKSLYSQSVSLIQDSFLTRSVGFQLFWTLGVFFASGFGVMVVIMYHPAAFLYVLLFIVVTIPTFFAVCRRASYFNRIVQAAQTVSAGYPQPDLPLKGNAGLQQLAGSINQMKRGVEVSQAAQAKSERLKTDLITNVSHDLRTPLTSIMTYAELLQKPDLSEENKAAYIDVINQKSKRLKVLIEDLFEASKMASGNAELSKERVDITQLLQQALAERDEAIASSSLEFRVQKPDTPVYATVDGQKMWRVFDNLIGNILKYSLDNTRVYISVESEPHKTVLTFKNIAKYELGGDIEELFERFKRGDESRNTDGSGLGLAIAKSIVDLHGGRLELQTDGDLFKATVILPNGN